MHQHSQQLQIVIVSASQSPASRSRLAAHQAHTALQTQPVMVDFIDLHEYALPTYPHAEGGAALTELIPRFNAADGWVLAVPVYNWGASAVLTNFLHYALDDAPARRYRPFVLLGGASGLRSHLALDGLARTLTYEISAVQVGPPVLAAGDLADPQNGVLDQDLQQRIARAMQVLVVFAGARVALRSTNQPRSLVAEQHVAC
jgi:NAD(P)H-dependent FMN reductase